MKNNMSAFLGTGSRNEPICFLFHKEYGYVPIIGIETHYIIWDDNQITRHSPPENSYEIARRDEFDLTKAVYIKSDKAIPKVIKNSA